MKRHTHVLVATACTAALALTAGACSASDDTVSGDGATKAVANDGPAVDGGTLKIGLDRPFAKLDPADSTLTSMPMMILTNALYDPLMINGDNGAVQPHLAKSFTPNADATGWTLDLREGVTFSDGKPLDGQAVVDHVTRLSKPEAKCACAADAAAIGGMAVNSPTSVVFTLKAPNAAFPNLFTRSLGYVSEAPAAADSPAVGSGPYTVESVQPGVSVTLARNPSYWGAKGHADKLVYKVLPDSDSRYQSLRSGDADLIWTETPAQYKQAAGDGLRATTGPGSTSTVLFNTKAAPFDDPKVRKAVQYAVDREAVEKIVYLGQGKVSDGPIGSTSPYRGAAAYPAHDAAKARALLAESGHPDLAFEYLVDNRPEGQQRATVLQQMFAEAGIKMTIKPMDSASLGTAMYQRQFQVMDFVTSLFGDTDTALASLYGTNAPYNFTGWNSPVAGQAIAAGRATLDQDRRTRSYQEAAQAVVDEAPMLFLTENPVGFLASAKTGGLPDVSKRTVVSVSPAALWVKK
ncbi:ABC transporter substrate-binding protein [Streptomyces sp. BE303]|uniref:ABC transporter substrate-binding protein n=1 Tax=Streptomyces sp. BE303 TaxID=3002528 RepID=UPI002E797DBD|nr:ABC transporter substrate-binding protein [Streptomyces sp. BE303]MED7950267.1 ABC transporter substrate-binding protein [Streptomyces sp. BE303]